MCYTILNALVLSVHDELLHVQGCTIIAFHSAWLGKKGFAASLECVSCGNCPRAQKSNTCVLYFVEYAYALLRASSNRAEAENHIMTLHTKNTWSGATPRAK